MQGAGFRPGRGRIGMHQQRRQAGASIWHLDRLDARMAEEAAASWKIFDASSSVTPAAIGAIFGMRLSGLL